MNTAKIVTGASFTAALFLVGLGSAAALPIVTVVDFSDQGATNDAGTGYATNYNGTTPAGAAWSSDPLVTPPPGNASGIYQSPFNSNALTASRTYFSVGGVDAAGDGATSPVSLVFDKPQPGLQSSFSLLWGSIDNYNTIEFLIGPAVIASLTGNELIAKIDPNIALTPITDGAKNYEKVALVNFTSGPNNPFTFDSVRFTSTQAAFEFALPTRVPEPTALALMGLGLLGAGFARRRPR